MLRDLDGHSLTEEWFWLVLWSVVGLVGLYQHDWEQLFTGLLVAVLFFRIIAIRKSTRRVSHG